MNWKRFLRTITYSIPIIVLSLCLFFAKELSAWAATLADKQYNSFVVDGTLLTADPIANKYMYLLAGSDGTNYHVIKTDSSGSIGFSGWPAATALADNDSNPTTTRVGANLLLFDGTTWDRAYNQASADSAGINSALETASFLWGFNGTTYDRVRSYAGNADAITSPTLGLLGTASYSLLYNGTTWDRMLGDANKNLMVSLGTQLDAVNDSVSIRIANVIPTMPTAGADTVSNTYNGMIVNGFMSAFNGTTWDRVRLDGAAGNLLVKSRVVDGSILTGYSQPGTNIEFTSSGSSSCTASNALTVGAYYEVQTDGRTHCTLGADNTTTATTSMEPYDSPGIYHRYVVDTSHDTFCCITTGASVIVDLTPQTLVAQ